MLWRSIQADVWKSARRWKHKYYANMPIIDQTKGEGEPLLGKWVSQPEGIDISGTISSYNRRASRKRNTDRPSEPLNNPECNGTATKIEVFSGTCVRSGNTRRRAMACRSTRWCSVVLSWRGEALNYSLTLRQKTNIKIVYEKNQTGVPLPKGSFRKPERGNQHPKLYHLEALIRREGKVSFSPTTWPGPRWACTQPISCGSYIFLSRFDSQSTKITQTTGITNCEPRRLFGITFGSSSKYLIITVHLGRIMDNEERQDHICPVIMDHSTTNGVAKLNLVNAERYARVQQLPDWKYRAGANRLVRSAKAKGLLPIDRIIPLTD